MSFTLVEQCPARLNRSELAVPGSNLRFLEKAPASAADVIFLDLEDAVAPDDKEQARKNIIQALNDLKWTGKTMSVRVNGLDTHYMYRDVVDVLEQAPGELDLIMIPKVGTAADVYALDMLVTQVEQANTLFCPSEAEVTKARRVIAAMDQAQKEGKGAVTLDGRLIDIASIRQAEVLVRKAEQVEKAGKK